MASTNTRLLIWCAFLALSLLLIHLLQPILGPFLLAVLSAYLGDPLADKLERWGLSRTWSVIIVFTLMTLVIVLSVLLLIPMIASQIDLLREVFPGYLQWFKETVLPQLHAVAGVDGNVELINRAQMLLGENWSSASDLLLVFFERASRSGLAIVGFLGATALVPVVAFYLLRDWDVLMGHIADLLPKKDLPRITLLAKECDEVLGAFLRGQLLIMICLGVIYTVGLALLGLDLALLVGMVAGLASVVPYLGAAIGIIAAAVAAIVQFQEPLYLLGVAAVFGIGQMLESLFLTPVLVGDKIGLHPVAVIFAVLAGGQLAGFAGVLLALPVAAVLMVLLRHAHHSYKNSLFYQAK